MITKRGLILAQQMSRHLKSTEATVTTLSRIARLACTHHRLQEIACSVEMNEKQQARHDRREASIEQTIAKHIWMLPKTRNGKIGVRFDGDPRGYTVKLIVPKAERDGNTWGLGGEFGV